MSHAPSLTHVLPLLCSALALWLTPGCGDDSGSQDAGDELTAGSDGGESTGGTATNPPGADSEPDGTGSDSAPTTGTDPDAGTDPDDTGMETGSGMPLDDSYEPGACYADLFVSSDPHPANGAYPAPSLTAMCTDTELVVQSNGIPGYEFQATTPNDLQGQDHTFTVPLLPTEGGEEDVPMLGTIAFAINGMPIFGPNEGPFPDPFGDPIHNGIMDFCLGHTAMAGLYHYHGLLVECLVGQVPPDEPSPIIGFALDGYPIFGPIGCLDEDCAEVVRFDSGWVQTGDPTTYAWDNHAYEPSDDPAVLDRCNGRIGPDGNYRYHATDTFPYVLGCYHGEP